MQIGILELNSRWRKYVEKSKGNVSMILIDVIEKTKVKYSK